MYSVSIGAHPGGADLMGTTVEDFAGEHSLAPGGIGVMEDAVQNPAKRAKIADLFNGANHIERAFGGHDLNISNEDDPMASPSTVAVHMPSTGTDIFCVGMCVLVKPKINAYKHGLPVMERVENLGRSLTFDDNTRVCRVLTDPVQMGSDPKMALVSMQWAQTTILTEWFGVVMSCDKSPDGDGHTLVLAVQHAVEMIVPDDCKVGDWLYFNSF